MSGCPAQKRIASEFPVANRALSIVAVKRGRADISEGNTGHFRPHPLFDWLHTNVKGLGAPTAPAWFSLNAETGAHGDM
jgi:hypothetical protein